MLSTPTLQWLDSKVLLLSSRIPKPGEASNKWLRVKKFPLRISSRKILSNYKTELKKENGSAKTALSKINQLPIAALFV